MATNLPTIKPETSNQDVKQFYDRYFVNKVSFPAEQIDITVSFFLKREFDLDAARSVAIVLLNQARFDNVNIFSLLDTLKGLTDIQLSQVVAEILNAYRSKTSVLGYKISTLVNKYESRNVLV